MSAKTNLVAAYNTLQKRIFKAKIMKGKSHEVIRSELNVEWNKLKASNNFNKDMEMLMNKYKPSSDGTKQTTLNFTALPRRSLNPSQNPSTYIRPLLPRPLCPLLPLPFSSILGKRKRHHRPSTNNDRNDNHIKYNSPHKRKPSKRVYVKTGQVRIQRQIAQLNTEIQTAKEDCRYLFKFKEGQDYKQKKALYERLLKQKELQQKKLRSMRMHNERNRECRQRKRAQNKIVKDKNIIKDYIHFDEPGKPRIEEYEKGKHMAAAMQSVANAHSSAHIRRRTENIECNLTTKTFAKKVNQQLEDEYGIENANIHHTTMYTRTEPRRKNTKAAKRHKATTNIKFRKVQNSHHNKTKSAHFVLALRKLTDSFFALLGSKYTIYIELDDKAKASFGQALTNKHGRLISGVRAVQRDDHDFKDAPRQFFHVSCYQLYAISNEGHIGDHKRVTWQGPLMIFVRSGYHEPQSAFNHAQDIERIFDDPRFDNWTKYLDEKTNTKKIKPIVHFGGDTAADEAARNDKVQASGLYLFKRFQLDTIICRNSPEKLSAMNRIERSMIYATTKMMGHCIANDHFGKHIVNGKIIDEELCLRNTQFGGERLATMFTGEHNGYPVYAEYIPPLMGDELVERDNIFESLKLDAFQTKKHCVLSLYHYQYRQCLKPDECKICEKKEFESEISSVYPPIMLQPPIVVDNSNGFKLVNSTFCCYFDARNRLALQC